MPRTFGSGLRLLTAPADLVDAHRGALSGVQLLALSFLGLIAVGTVGLLALPGLYTGEGLGFIDALFTATSAVCVTGLIVVDTATYFTPLGQAWIALLIQLGGLGILTFATLVISAVGGRAGLRIEEATGTQTASLPRLDPRTLVRSVVLLTLTVEAAGALLLWLLWAGRFGAAGAVWPAVFHAISAFCNAGFSVFSDSLESFQRAEGTIVVVAGLIVIGGVGFVVLEDLRVRVRYERHRLSMHSRLVLGATALLLVGATTLYFVFEAGGTLRELSWLDRIVNAGFMAVTPRTAGFNTVSYDAISNPSLFLTVILMLIGGAPGSTAGGIKTTTVALLCLLLVSRLRGQRDVSLFGRSVPPETIARAAGLAIGGLAVLGTAVFALMMTETPGEVADRVHFTRVVFEAHSAFGTVGLSMGATPHLTPLGKVVIVFLMYLGRIGPLTVAAAMAFAGRQRGPQYRYAYEDVAIG